MPFESALALSYVITFSPVMFMYRDASSGNLAYDGGKHRYATVAAFWWSADLRANGTGWWKGKREEPPR